MGFLLFILSIGLSVVLYPIGLLTSIVISFRKSKFKIGLKRLDLQFLSIAKSVDANGNVVCSDLLNLIFIKNGYKFGNRKETVSSVLGKNQLTQTLTTFGRVILWILNLLDRNHGIKSIDTKI